MFRTKQRLLNQIAALEGERVQLQQRNTELWAKCEKAKEDRDAVARFVREQNDADLYWAARKIMRQADRAAGATVSGFGDIEGGFMRNALAAAQQRAAMSSAIGSVTGFAGLFPLKPIF